MSNRKDVSYRFEQDKFLASLASSPFSGLETVFVTGPTPAKDRLTNSNIKMIAFGLCAILMYCLLFKYQAVISHIAELAHHGEHRLFFVPIVVALAFSYVHGTFTANFWDSLDIRSKKKEVN